MLTKRKDRSSIEKGALFALVEGETAKKDCPKGLRKSRRHIVFPSTREKKKKCKEDELEHTEGDSRRTKEKTVH